MISVAERLAALKANPDVINQLTGIFAGQAQVADDPNRFYRIDIISASNLHPNFKMERAAAKAANPRTGARELIEWAISKNVNTNPGYREYTAIGSILEPLLDLVGWEEARQIAATIVAYRLYLNPDRLRELMTKYSIPAPAEGTGLHADGIHVPLGETGRTIGPAITWRGPDGPGERELQAFWQQPDYFDVGFLMRATDAARAVCRIELPSKGRLGTGFLIEPGLLLTNYHVLKDEEDPGDEIQANAAEAVLRFGYVTAANGAAAEVREFKLAEEGPILFESPVSDLDFVLLKVEEAVKYEQGVKPLPNQPRPAGNDQGLNVIQHPAGETLKVALSSNGVANVDESSGLIQYVSKTAGGSSGSPCFNNKWELVAVHHAEVSTLWGSRREGILYRRIHEKIKGLLKP